jgi:hypothetical protein
MSEMQRKPTKRPFGPASATLIIIFVVGLFLGWGYFTGKFPLQQKPQDAGPETTTLEEKIAGKEELPAERIPPGEGDLASLPSASGETGLVPSQKNECRETADRILLFFERLDRQNYIREYPIKGSTLEHFKGIVSKLLANPPVVARETDDLFAILNNMAHFFRILGPKDILLIKDVLMHEREIIEPTMALFYRWSELDSKCTGNDLDLSLPLAGLYEYAGYFINTLGGQAYLFRRELYLRHLLRYYSVLIVDRANEIDANRYGIDIRYTLDSLISEIQGNSDLIEKQAYLEELIRLQKRYQAVYGARQ